MLLRPILDKSCMLEILTYIYEAIHKLRNVGKILPILDPPPWGLRRHFPIIPKKSRFPNIGPKLHKRVYTLRNFGPAVN